MSVIVTQDESHPEGGYAVLRFSDATVGLERASLLFQPLDDLPPDAARWPRGRIAAVETRLRDGALEVVVGPDAVNALPAYTAVHITLTGVDQKTRKEFDLRDECRWPALIMQQQRRRRKLPDVVQPTIAEPVEYRERRRTYSAPDAESGEVEITGSMVAESGPRVELPGEQPEEALSVPAVPEPSTPKPSLPQELKLAGSDKADISGGPTSIDVKLPGSDSREEPKELAKAELAHRPDTDPDKPVFGRAGAVSPQPRSRFAVLPVLIALLVGIAAGGLGYRQIFQPPGTISGGGSADGGSTDGAADSGPADRLLMEALDSADTTSDGASIFGTSKDDFWWRANQKEQSRDFVGAVQNYRMATRVALCGSSLPNLLKALIGALEASETTKPEAARLSRLFFSLGALAGDPGAFNRLADSYQPSDPDHAQRLRERARTLNPTLQNCQGA